jgi:acyl dehydratase
VKKDVPHYLEDVKVGQRFTTASLTVDRDSLKAFARQYDPQPIHLDETAAEEGFFGELVGSGWQTLCLTMRLVVEARPLGTTPLIGLEVDEIRFHRPLRPGDSLRAEAEVLSVRASKSKPERGFLRMRVDTLAGDKPLASRVWTLLVPARGSVSSLG